MRLGLLSMLAGVTFVVATTPASAQWRSYISTPLGLAFSAPGSPKLEKGTYDAPAAGKHETIAYSFTENDIDYKVIVVDTRAEEKEAATILGEDQFYFQEGANLLGDTLSRVNGHYGRKLTVDLPKNGGRSIAAFYFVDGRIVTLQATVRPAKGKNASPDVDRFINSISFSKAQPPAGATELPPG